MNLVAAAGAFPGKSIPQAVALSAAAGFGRIELLADFDPAADSLGNAFLLDPALIRAACAAANVRVASLLVPVPDARNLTPLAHAFALAAAIDCPVVRARSPVLLEPLATFDTAGRTLLLDVPAAVPTLWHFLDRFDRPFLKCVLPVDPLGTAVPTLNSRLGGVRLGPDLPPARHLLQRLRGIGFTGLYLVDQPTHLQFYTQFA